MNNNTSNVNLLASFLKFVDGYTYILDGERYHNVDNEKITNEELAFIFLDSELNIDYDARSYRIALLKGNQDNYDMGLITKDEYNDKIKEIGK